MSSFSPSPAGASRRHGSTLTVLLLGAALAGGVLALFHYGPLRNSVAFRYVEFPVQWVEVLFFCCGLGALFLKFVQLRGEHGACGNEVLPRWDGKPVPAERASELAASLDRQPARVQDTYLGRRLRAVLDFVCQRKSAADLDDQLRTLADNDAIAQENSFALVRFITWAIPILGFLGTVIGITGAISGVTPEVLEESLSSVTDGLSEAFDSTALALGLTMLLMFVTFLVERQEQALLELVDRLTEQWLGHRFARDAGNGGGATAVIQHGAQELAAAVEGILVKQAEVWSATLKAPEARAVDLLDRIQEKLTTALGQALDQTIDAYSQRLAALEERAVEQSTRLMTQIADMGAAIQQTGIDQQAALQKVVDRIGQQAELLAQLQKDTGTVANLQATLQSNLAALADANAFEEAVHSLTAAVHLLTARSGGTSGPRLARGQAA
ncbi:MAG: MotA/TolQ/ExbB proton channel family protein [Gemmataceae bacterium]